MTKAPYILICGGAGSGKDTVGGMLAQALDGVCVAQADPMKALAKTVFDFTDNQLWGPSEARNEPDPRFNDVEAWGTAVRRLYQYGRDWVESLRLNPDTAFPALIDWFRDVARTHGFTDVVTGGAHLYAYGNNVPAFYQFRGTSTRQLTPRYVLQTLGTEFGRVQNPDMWNDFALRQGDRLLAGGYTYSRWAGAVVDASSDFTSSRGLKPYGMLVITDGRFPNEAIGVKRRGGYLINVVNPVADDGAVEKAGVAGHASEKGVSLIPGHWYDAVIINDKRQGLLALENVVNAFVSRIKKGVDVYSTSAAGEVGSAR